MGGPAWPPSRFWQYWALAGMVVLTAAFWWGVEGYAIFEARRHGQIAEGLLRFTLLILTPALVLAWLAAAWLRRRVGEARSEEHTSELQSLMRISYAVFCLKKKKNHTTPTHKTVL